LVKLPEPQAYAKYKLLPENLTNLKYSYRNPQTKFTRDGTISQATVLQYAEHKLQNIYGWQMNEKY